MCCCQFQWKIMWMNKLNSLHYNELHVIFTDAVTMRGLTSRYLSQLRERKKSEICSRETAKENTSPTLVSSIFPSVQLISQMAFCISRCLSPLSHCINSPSLRTASLPLLSLCLVLIGRHALCSLASAAAVSFGMGGGVWVTPLATSAALTENRE